MMHDLIFGVLAVADDLVRLVTSQQFVRVLLGTAIIVGVLLVGTAVIVGALAIIRIGLAAIVRLATRRLAP